MPNSTPDFRRLIASLDGDEELLATIAAPVAGFYSAFAEQMRMLLDDTNYPGLKKIAHKLKATWSMYADNYHDAPEQLEAAINANDTGQIIRQTELLINELQLVSARLNNWLEIHTQDTLGKHGNP
jgi:hypothetical protein